VVIASLANVSNFNGLSEFQTKIIKVKKMSKRSIDITVFLGLTFLTIFLASCATPPTFTWPENIPEIKQAENLGATPFDEWKDARLQLENPSLVAGAAIVDLTPPNPRSTYIAGYMPNKKAKGVAGPITGRILVLDDGKQTFITIGLDFVGYMNDRVWDTRHKISKKYAKDIMISSTHTHAGPDTMGLWGNWAFFMVPVESGVDENYMNLVEERLAAGVVEAISKSKEVYLVSSEIEVPEGLSYNSHREGYQDNMMTVLQVRDMQQNAVATVINWACHAEFLGQNNEYLSPDFPGYLYPEVEKREGGVAIFLNGAVGGIIVPALPRRTEANVRVRDQGARRAGKVLASYASKALQSAKKINAEKIVIERKVLRLPIENDLFEYMGKKGYMKRYMKEKHLLTEVWRVDLGHLSILTVPGEIFPSLGFRFKDLMPHKHKMVVGLSNDELGYIMTREEWDDPLYDYEKTVSVGKQTGPLLTATVKKLYQKK